MCVPRLQLALIAILSASMMGPEATASQSLSSSPIAWSIATPERLVMQGRIFSVTVRAAIPHGVHLYALTQVPGGPIAVHIAVDSAGAFMLSGAVAARIPDRALDPTFGFATETYSDSVTFTVPVVAQSAGAQQLRLLVDYQSCTDRLCLPPRHAALALSLSVTPGGQIAAPNYSLLPTPPRSAGAEHHAAPAVASGVVTRDDEAVRMQRRGHWPRASWAAVAVLMIAMAWGAARLMSRRPD